MIKLCVNSYFYDVLKNNLESAEDSICIIIYNWYFYQKDLVCKTSIINDIIFEKLKNKIKVKVIVGNITLYNQLKERGVDVRYNRVRGLNHAKVVIVDNKFCSVGSHNFSENAWERNEEASIVSDDIDLINQCKKYFNILYQSCL